jgi:antitoxin component of MazEF toxin-antitoxin module
MAVAAYTASMKVVQVRRVGESNVISIPREFEALGYGEGSSVIVEELPGGDLRIMSTENVRERIHDIGERVVAEHGQALQILADHDPDADSASR